MKFKHLVISRLAIKWSYHRLNLSWDEWLNDTVISEIVNNIEDEDTILIWKMRYPQGNILPDNISFSTLRTSSFSCCLFIFTLQGKCLRAYHRTLRKAFLRSFYEVLLFFHPFSFLRNRSL